MYSAAQHIDHYVHDILDYTILDDNEMQFEIDEQVFDVKNAIDDIISIKKDKIVMKDIQLSIEYKGFEHNLIMTD